MQILLETFHQEAARLLRPFVFPDLLSHYVMLAYLDLGFITVIHRELREPFIKVQNATR